MGSSHWSDDFYTDRAATRASSGAPVFAYNAAVASGTVAAKAHSKLDPKGVTRESRDSVEHPDSVAIAVMFDVTGSMARVPRTLQAKLPKLMGLLLRKGYVKDPQVLFGAIGDYHSDKVPLQVGQFESGIEMDDDVTNLVLEGGGGGSYEESYQNALYFFGHHTSIDCFEKRGRKGYLFLIGDEKPYARSTKAEIESIFGDSVQDDVTVEEAVRAAQEKYHVFYVIPSGTTHYNDPELRKHWESLINPQHVLMLEDPEAVCESIGLAIGLLEGTATGDSMAADLGDVGAAASVIRTVSTALDPLAKSVALTRVGSGDLPVRHAGDASVQRL